MKQVKQISVKAGMGADELVREFGRSGVFQAGALARAAGVWEAAVRDKSKLVLSVAGAMVPGGLRQVISDLIRDGYVDLLVTTGANITHDLAICFGEEYYVHEGQKDTELRKHKASRIYDIVSPDESAITFEKEIQKIFADIPEGEYSTPEIIWEIGKRIKDDDSVVRQSFLKKIPIYVPALEDSILGIQLWIHSQDRKVKPSPLKDVAQVTQWMYANENRAAIMLGGGVPKNFALQSGLIPGPYRYAVQITLDRPESGGLSGATLEEAVSWGKLNAKSKHATVYSDTTICFPLIVAALRTRLEKK